MAEEKLLTVREASIILGISEKEVIDLAESGVMPAYKIGGVYLRFRKDQVEGFRKSFEPPALHKRLNDETQSFGDKLKDFFYYNDFYIFAATLIILLIVFIFQG